MTRWGLVLLLTAACARHQPRPGEAPADVCTPANHDRTVTVSGYLTPPSVPVCEQTCPMFISPVRNEERGVWAHFRIGLGPGLMKPIVLGPEGSVLTLKDFQVTDATGTVTHGGEVVRVTGLLSFMPGARPEPCRLDVTTVETLR